MSKNRHDLHPLQLLSSLMAADSKTVLSSSSFLMTSERHSQRIVQKTVQH